MQIQQIANSTISNSTNLVAKSYNGGQAPQTPHGFVALRATTQSARRSLRTLLISSLNMVKCGLGQRLKFVKGLGKLLHSLQFMAWMNCGLDQG